MAEIILKFDADEERNDAQTAIDGWKWKNAMWELDQKLRNTTKYYQSIFNEGKEATEVEVLVAEAYRELIQTILTDYNLKMD